MPQLRYNMMTGDWVIVAPERARRPDAHGQPRPAPPGPAHVATCPFCAGNEASTPPETARVAGEGGWLVRAVPNRFPALQPEGAPEHAGGGYRRSMRGVGLHEVVIETPRHDATTALLPPTHVEQVLRLSQARMAALYGDARIEHVILFKNHGEWAGSSIDHPHAQIVGTPVIPNQVRVRLDHALRQYDELGECLTCHCLRQELEEGARLVEVNAHFAAFVPYAALSPFHLWIVPRQHRAHFGDVGAAELEALGAIVQRTLRRVYVGLGNPPFNYVVRSLSPREAGARHFHWYLSIIVRNTRAAGFELGTGMFINASLPEDSAAYLREQVID